MSFEIRLKLNYLLKSDLNYVDFPDPKQCNAIRLLLLNSQPSLGIFRPNAKVLDIILAIGHMHIMQSSHCAN